MKIDIVILLLLSAYMMLLSTGCGESRQNKYESAVLLFEGGKYAEALEVFTELGDYEDSVSYTERATSTSLI